MCPVYALLLDFLGILEIYEIIVKVMYNFD